MNRNSALAGGVRQINPKSLALGEGRVREGEVGVGGWVVVVAWRGVVTTQEQCDQLCDVNSMQTQEMYSGRGPSSPETTREHSCKRSLSQGTTKNSRVLEDDLLASRGP